MSTARKRNAAGSDAAAFECKRVYWTGYLARFRLSRKGGFTTVDSMDPDEIREKYGHLPYVTPYERIVALVDDTEETVELHEFHARGRCEGGAAWEVYHYPGTSPLVVSARREGARNIFVCAAAFFHSIAVPEELRLYRREAGSRMVPFEEAQWVARQCAVRLEAVTGRRGCIGALAAIGAHDDPDGAVRLPEADR